MARVLGISCKGSEVLLAVAEDGELVDGLPERVQTPALYEQTEGLLATMDEIRRAVSRIAPDGVRLLLPEQTYEDRYPRIAPRIALETLVRVVCAQEGHAVELMYPNSARGRLDANPKGPFENAIAAVLPEPVGHYWKAGRNRAAAAALAREA